MSFNYRLLALLFFLIIISCNNNSKSKNKFTPKKESIKKIPKLHKKTEQKKADSINNKNAVNFLIAYGKQHKEDKVLIKTRLGNFVILLYNDVPLHKANFLFLTQVGYFNTTCFHRVVPGFIVQGGNSENPQALRIRNKYKNYTIPPEFRSNRKHKYGAVAAAREWENNPGKVSNPFEFYIIQGKEGAHHLDGEHTVFGEVISGMPVVNKIANLKAGRDQWPLQDVFIKAEIVK